MGSQFYRLKIGLYILVIVMVGILFGVRVNNAWLKTNYAREVIFRDGDIEISLHYPAKILSPKIDASYPLVLSFYYSGDTTSPHTYEVSLQSPTLLFVDAKGGEITPYFQFTSSQTFYEQSVYVRPYLSEAYPAYHTIDFQAFVDDQEAQTQSSPVKIRTEPMWFSFVSLAAASFLEISILGALVAWIAYAVDSAMNLKKDLISKRHNDLNLLASLSYWERLHAFVALEDQIRRDHLENDLRSELQQIRNSFANSEREFIRALGEQLR